MVKNSNELLVTTSFGTLLISAKGHKSVFNPYQLAPSLSPQLIPELIESKNYTSAILVALKLNMSVKALLKKIPIQYSKATISEMEEEWGSLLLERICGEGKVSGRELVWVEGLLEKGISPVAGLRGALEGMEEQTKVLNRVLGSLEMVELIGVNE